MPIFDIIESCTKDQPFDRLTDETLELLYAGRPGARGATKEDEHQYRYRDLKGGDKIETFKVVRKAKKLEWDNDDKNWIRLPASTDIDIFNIPRATKGIVSYWTKKEDTFIRNAVAKGGKNYWKKMADHLNRKRDDIIKRWQRVLKIRTDAEISAHKKRKHGNLEISNWGNTGNTDDPEHYLKQSRTKLRQRAKIQWFAGKHVNQFVSRIMLDAKLLRPRFDKETEGRTSAHHIDSNHDNNNRWNLGTFNNNTRNSVSFFHQQN